MKCIFVEGGGLNEETGKLNPKPMLDLILNLPEDFQTIFFGMGRKCVSIKHKDLCQQSFLIQKCLKQGDPVHYFLF